MAENPIYTSKSTFKNLWQEYRIYRDRVEFETLFGAITVPFDKIERISVEESNVKGLLRGDLQLKNFRPAVKLDWANFTEHVVLDKDDGFCRRFLFTPENPAEFKEVLEKQMKEHPGV